MRRTTSSISGLVNEQTADIPSGMGRAPSGHRCDAESARRVWRHRHLHRVDRLLGQDCQPANWWPLAPWTLYLSLKARPAAW